MRSTQIIRCGALALGAIALFACNDPFSNEDILYLKKTLPTKQALSVAVPQSGDASMDNACAAYADGGTGPDTGMSTPDGGVPTPSFFYGQAVAAGCGLQGAIDFVFDTIGPVSQLPPTQRKGDLRYWGPFPADQNGVEWALAMSRSTTTSTVFKGTSTSTRVHAPGRLEYILAGRSANTQNQFIPVIEGFSPIIDDDATQMGYIFLDFDAGKLLKPSSKDTGRLLIAFDTRFGQRTIEAEADATPPGLKPFSQGPLVGYRFHVDAADNTQFGFYAHGNIENPPQPNDTKLEDLLIFTRFAPDKRGRADVVAANGDIPAGTYFWFSECWDSSFDQVYYLADFPTLTQVGDVTSCAPGLQTNPFTQH
jgi:hypothetical protein